MGTHAGRAGICMDMCCNRGCMTRACCGCPIVVRVCGELKGACGRDSGRECRGMAAASGIYLPCCSPQYTVVVAYCAVRRQLLVDTLCSADGAHGQDRL